MPNSIDLVRHMHRWIIGRVPPDKVAAFATKVRTAMGSSC
jgi:hypothetical protein